MTSKACPTCNGSLIQKNKGQLVLTGVLFSASAITLLVMRASWWPLVVFIFMIGLYLILWGSLGKGLWCRQCKASSF